MTIRYHLAQPRSWRTTPFSAPSDSLFNVFAATLRFWRPSSPPADREYATSRRQQPTYHCNDKNTRTKIHVTRVDTSGVLAAESI
jgi:hypothetical protein